MYIFNSSQYLINVLKIDNSAANSHKQIYLYTQKYTKYSITTN